MKYCFNICRICLFLVSVFSVTALVAQEDSLNIHTDSVQKRLTVSYSLQILSNGKSGVAESYNGGIKTIYFQQGKIRSRLVSLMRIQSVFYFYSEPGKADHIYMVKESGKKNYTTSLKEEQWQVLNKKYRNAGVELVNDSVVLLNYICRKAVVTLQDGKIITCYYTPQIHAPELGYVEPLFSFVPGLVLQYEYVNDKATFLYKATEVSFQPVSGKVFVVPK